MPHSSFQFAHCTYLQKIIAFYSSKTEFTTCFLSSQIIRIGCKTTAPDSSCFRTSLASFTWAKHYMARVGHHLRQVSSSTRMTMRNCSDREGCGYHRSPRTPAHRAGRTSIGRYGRRTPIRTQPRSAGGGITLINIVFPSKSLHHFHKRYFRLHPLFRSRPWTELHRIQLPAEILHPARRMRRRRWAIREAQHRTLTACCPYLRQ